VMAILIILVSLDSSEDSVGTTAGRVILFGTILTTILDTTPDVLPFLSSDDDTTDSDTLDTPPSPTHDTPFTEIAASSQRSPVIPRRQVMILAPGQPIPHDSSSRHSLSDHSSPDLLSTSVGPSRKRRRSPMTSVPALPLVFGADTIHRDTNSYIIVRFTIHLTSDHTTALIIIPIMACSSEQVVNRGAIGDYSDYFDFINFIGTGRVVNRGAIGDYSDYFDFINFIGTGRRVRDIGYLADVEVGPRETRVEMVTHPAMPGDIPEPTQEGAVEVTYETLGDLVQRFHDHTESIPVHRIQVIEGVQREQGHKIVGVESAVAALTERVAELKRDNRRLRGTASVESQRVDRLQRGMIETMEEGTNILATVDGTLRTISKSSIRTNLKLNDEAGISSLSDAELFENLTLMGYNISPNQKFTFQKGQFSPTNRVFNFSKMIFDGMVRNVNNKVSKFLMYPQFLSICLRMGQFGQITHTHTYVVLFHTRKLFTTLRGNSPSFSGRTVPLFDSMLVPQGEGSGTPTEPHHTPTSKASQSSQHELPSPSLPPVPTESFPTIIPSDNPPLRQYTRRARIAQSSAFPPIADEPASPIGDDSQGEACPTVSGLEADQDMANIPKTSTLPSDSTPRVTSLAADDGSLQQNLDELTALCTSLQRQELEINSGVVSTASPTIPTASLIFTTPIESTLYTRRKGKETMVESETPKKKKIARDVEIAKIHAKEELQMLIDGLDRNNETVTMYLQEYYQFAAEFPIERRIELISDLVRLEQDSSKKLKTSEEVPEEKLKEMMELIQVEEVYVEVLQVKHPIIDWEVHTKGERSYWKIVRLGGSTIPTGSGVVSTASPTIPTASLIFTTPTKSTPYTRRKGKETMVESETPKKKKVQEQIDVQLARELEEEMARDA
nr:hypothetical protein [Tanacetum cinerariifolium]